MTVKNRRWQQALFPIDETLLDRLLDDYCASLRDGEAGDDDESAGPCEWLLDDEPCDDDEVEITVLVVGSPATDGDDYSLNMRVLDDYLRRRLDDEAEERTGPTLH